MWLLLGVVGALFSIGFKHLISKDVGVLSRVALRGGDAVLA